MNQTLLNRIQALNLDPFTETEVIEIVELRLRPISEKRAELEAVKKAMGAFLGAYLNIRTGDQGGAVALYVAHLSEYPLAAIMEALGDFKNGRVIDRTDAEGNPVYFTLDHAPSAFRILDQVKKHTAPLQEQQLLTAAQVRQCDDRQDPRTSQPLHRAHLSSGPMRRIGRMKETKNDSPDHHRRRAREAAGSPERIGALLRDLAPLLRPARL